MEKQPKKILFVSWKKHKVEQALSQIDNVCNVFINELLFESIIDFFREKSYPKAVPVYPIIQNEPVIPNLHENNLRFETPVIPRPQKCPICHETMDASRFTSHLVTKCFKECKDKMEVIHKFFEMTPPQASSLST